MRVSQDSGISGNHFFSALYLYDCFNFFIEIVYYLYYQEKRQKSYFHRGMIKIGKRLE